MRLKRIEQAISSKDSIHKITYDDDLKPRIPLNRKPGRPKFKWAEKGINEYWEMIRKKFKYDQNDENQRELIKTYASATIQTPRETWSQIENIEPTRKQYKTRDETVPHPPGRYKQKRDSTLTAPAQKTAK